MFTWTVMSGNIVLGTVTAPCVDKAYVKAGMKFRAFNPKKDRLLSSEAVKLGYGNNAAVAEEGKKSGKKRRGKREQAHQ